MKLVDGWQKWPTEYHCECSVGAKNCGPSFDIINYLFRWNKDDSKITMKIKGGQGVGESSGGWGGWGKGVSWVVKNGEGTIESPPID
jgi:hypothetical protein